MCGESWYQEIPRTRLPILADAPGRVGREGYTLCQKRVDFRWSISVLLGYFRCFIFVLKECPWRENWYQTSTRTRLLPILAGVPGRVGREGCTLRQTHPDTVGVASLFGRNSYSSDRRRPLTPGTTPKKRHALLLFTIFVSV